jgi:imidazolonepropionase-like amidohydrolase
MPGFSLHDELANFVEAGFTPMESLQTATSNPAKFLGTQASIGLGGIRQDRRLSVAGRKPAR